MILFLNFMRQSYKNEDFLCHCSVGNKTKKPCNAELFINGLCD